MALNLDSRQRAMLQDMGITVWWPKAPAVAAAPAAIPAVELAVTASAEVVAAPAPGAAPVRIPPIVTPAAVVAPAAPLATPAPASPMPASVPATAEHTAWQICAPVQAYPEAHGGSADEAWLVIWEAPHAHAPLQGDSGQLLNNMLRALRLQHSPHVWIASVQRPDSTSAPLHAWPAEPVAWQPLSEGLAQAVKRTRPARVLVLGLHAARAVVGSQEALGRLRAQVHQVQGVPAIVSYDPAYLLRSPHAKPAAWADLCRAHALRPPLPH